VGTVDRWAISGQWTAANPRLGLGSAKSWVTTMALSGRGSPAGAGTTTDFSRAGNAGDSLEEMEQGHACFGASNCAWAMSKVSVCLWACAVAVVASSCVEQHPFAGLAGAGAVLVEQQPPGAEASACVAAWPQVQLAPIPFAAVGSSQVRPEEHRHAAAWAPVESTSTVAISHRSATERCIFRNIVFIKTIVHQFSRLVE